MTVENKAVSGRRVLVVEDDEDIARLIEMHLTDCGFAVTVVRDGIHAETLANDETFSLITLDLSLPGIDALAAQSNGAKRTTFNFQPGHNDLHP